MTAILSHVKPKTLAPGEGEAQLLLEHLRVGKATLADTNEHYKIFKIIYAVGDSAPLHSLYNCLSHRLRFTYDLLHYRRSILSRSGRKNYELIVRFIAK